MKFTYSEKAKKFISDNNIKNVAIKIGQGGSCCGVDDVRVDIRSNINDTRGLREEENNPIIPTYYDPSLDNILKKYDEIVISVFGVGKFKKFVSMTEFNPVDL